MERELKRRNKLKKIIFGALVVFLFPFLVFGSDKQENKIFKSCFIVKNNDEADFRVELPAGWTAKLGADQKLSILAEKKDKDGKNIKKAMILVGFDINKTDTDITPGYLEKIIKSYKALMDDNLAKEGVKQSEGAVGKYKGVKLEYQLKIGKSVSKYWQYLSKINKEDIAIITCTAPAQVFKDFEEDFKTIMGSMEIVVAPIGK